MTFPEKLDRFKYYRELGDKLFEGEIYTGEEPGTYLVFEYGDEVVRFMNSLTPVEVAYLRKYDFDFYVKLVGL